MKHSYQLINFHPPGYSPNPAILTIQHFHQRSDCQCGDGKFIMVFENVFEAKMIVGHGRFILHRYVLSTELLVAYQLHATHSPEGVDLYTRDILRESARTDTPVKLLLDKDGFVLRAEIYHEYWDDRSLGKKPS